jgi:hypothetical protein
MRGRTIRSILAGNCPGNKRFRRTNLYQNNKLSGIPYKQLLGYEEQAGLRITEGMELLPIHAGLLRAQKYEPKHYFSLNLKGELQ